MAHRAGTPPSKKDGRVAQQTRLHKRGNVYYFRARIPQNIQHLYAPQTEIKFSLRTASLKEAKALVNQFSVKYDAEFDLQQQAQESQDALPTVLRIVDEATAKAIGRLWVRQVVDGDEHIRQMVSDEEFAAREADLATSEQFMRQALARGKVDIVEPVMTQFLGLKGRVLYGRRFATVEPVFGNVRHNKRLDRFTLRGRRKVNSQWQLYCLVHNIEKLAHHGYGQ